MEEIQKIALFKKKEIRKIIHNGEWWFVVADVVEALVDTVDVNDYIKKMRSRDDELVKGWGQIVTPLPIKTIGGTQNINCANTEGIFRIVQSIPSPKAVIL
ncbi:MAG: Bro-N domain-containing protein [bacterium]